VAPFGRFAAASNLGSAAAESAREDTTSYLEERKNPNWMPMTLGAAALAITLAGGAFFFHLGPFGNSGSGPAASASASSTNANNSAPASLVAAANTGITPTPVVAANVPVRPAETAPVKVTKAPVQEALRPAAPVQQAPQPTAPVHVKSAAKVPDMFGALNAHPVSPRRGSDAASAESAPSVDATGASGPLKGLASSIAPPSPLSETLTPGSDSGQLKMPRLVSSVVPVYPQIAQQAGVEGDVVVEASIDNTGKVSATKVLSGPLMLRQAAMDAVRRWKYEPAILDGKTVATQMTVRIRFHR
jgi:protein TonB